METHTIDMHAHFFPAIRQEELPSQWKAAPWLRIDSATNGMIMVEDKPFRPVDAPLWDASARIEELDRLEVNMQIVCATPVMFGYSQPAAVTAEWAKKMNDRILEHCAYRPNRLKALAQVPLQDTELACIEASRAKANGHVGVQIGNHVGEKDLDDSQLVDFLDHCARNDIPVLVHPWDMMGEMRMKKWMLPWLVAMPAETQLSILSLILSGAFDRLPKNLKICFAHGGGSFVFILPRVDNAWQHRDIIRQNCPNPPSSYVNRFYVDSAVFSNESLHLLVKVMGSERVMLGSDYPFPLGEQEIGALVRNSPVLNEQERHKVLSRNAKQFFNLN